MNSVAYINETARHQTACVSACDARQLKLAEHEQLVAALPRAQRTAETTRSTASRHAEAAEALIDSHSERLQEWHALGAEGDMPSMIADAGAVRARMAADAEATAAKQALAALQAQIAAKKLEVDKAETAVRSAVNQLLIVEGETIAAEIEHHEAEAVAKRERLLGLVADGWQHRPINQLPLTSPLIERALSPPEFGSASRYSAMINERGEHRARIAAHGAQWRKRIAALIAGVGAEPTASSEQSV